MSVVAQPASIADFEVLLALGVEVRITKCLDGQDSEWDPEADVLTVGADITRAEADDLVCLVLGMLACA